MKAKNLGKLIYNRIPSSGVTENIWAPKLDFYKGGSQALGSPRCGGVRYANGSFRCATRGLLATDHVILNHGQVTWTTPELAPPLLTTTAHQREDVSALDRFNVHRCPTRWVFSGTGLELVGIKMAKIEKETHLEEAERARSQMPADRMATSEKLFVFSFDLEKAFAFPKLTTSVAYYKRNLYVYNFGCHELNKNISHMFVWPETEGSRGSQEISSCLIKYI
ncbi:uncharacterized protein TNCV_5012541 [Trichonephila clavipes]|nr:uncharacterized protein TNCV_5012541 [Trichonephila clavipes]